MKQLKLYYHLVAQQYCFDFFNQNKNLMQETGLWDAFNTINLCLHYDDSFFNSLRKELETDYRVKFIFLESHRPFGEQYTNIFLKQQTDTELQEHFILRFHSKGINHYLHPTEWPPNKKITDELNYQNINRWQECVDKLHQGYDAVGAHWVKQPWPHFKGNIWWASSNYIKRLNALKPPHVVGFQQQIRGGGWTVHDAESWVGTANPKAWDILRNTDEIGDHPDL